MSLLDAGALGALVLAVPLIALHLRRRKPPRRAVGSLLAWRDLPAVSGGGARRVGRPPLPLLLALQLLALVLLVFALAHPVNDRSAAGSSRVYVVDESMWMGATEAGATRIDAARAELREDLAGAPAGEAVQIVGAGAAPTVLYEGDAAGAGAAVAKLRAGPGAADLPAALRLAAGLRSGDGSQVTLLRAPEEAAPRVLGGGVSSYGDRTVGHAVGDAGLSDASANCDRLGAEECEVFVRVSDRGGTAARVPVRIAVSGAPTRTETVAVPVDGTAPLVFGAPAGAAVEVSLPGGDALAADDSAFVAVPQPGGERITLVGERTRALPLARALASVPGVQLRLRTPQTYKASDPGSSDLLVLDDFVPKGGLPDAPGLLLVNPPRFPGGGPTGKMEDSRMSGFEAASPLLEGVELASLTIGAGASRRLSLPASLTAAAWSSEGPLIASGTDGGRRVATISFEPSESNLPQLAGFPTLIDNIVAWTQRLAPASAAAGTPFALTEPPGTTAASLAPAAGGATEALAVAAGSEVPVSVAEPGNYVLSLRGPSGTRQLAVAVNPAAAPAAGAPVDLGAPAPPAGTGHTDWWPWVLAAALLVLVIEALYAWWREPERGPTTRRRVAVGLQVASLVLVAVALLDLTTGSVPQPTTLVLDRSLSIGPAAGQAESAWLAAEEGCGEECHVVQFGGGAELTGGGSPLPSAAGGSVEGRQSNLQGALGLALARTPRGGRVVLLSDGRQTAGEPLGFAAAARARGVSLDTVALTTEPADAAVTRLQAPPALHAGDPLSLEVTVRSTVAAPGRLVVRRDGKVVGHQQVKLGVGDNPFLFGVRAPLRPGSYGYEVEVRSVGDSRAGNDALGTTVRVERAPRAIVAGPANSTAAALIEADGFDVISAPASELPTTAAGYAGADAVVLEDVSNEELGKARAKAIEGAVRSRALGLLALGGEHSFSLGKYYKSPLQDVLPVKSLVPGKLQRKNVAVELILDRSGSMINEVGGVPKIAMAQAAANSALEFLLKHRDQIGITTFEINAKALVPLTRVEAGNVGLIEHKIDTLPANGGTNIYKGLATGVEEILRSTAKDRHIILLTDGISEPGTYKQLLPALKKAKISVAAVALGAEADFKLLKEIATETGGNYYSTENARELPKIFSKEVRLNTRTVRLRGQIGVSAGDPSPITGSLVGQTLPPLGGNVVTELKPGAEAALLGQDKDHPPDPVLAQWQYGAGRVAAWTPGLSPESAGEWLARPRLFQDAARWVERGVAPPVLTPSLAPGDQRRLEVAPTAVGSGRPIELSALAGTLTSAAGKKTTLRFEESAAGRWTAPLPELPAGEYEYALTSRGAGSLTGTLAVPYAAELRLGRLDTTPLGPLAAAAGGSTLDAADPGTVGGSSHHIWWLFAGLALACFLVGAVLRLLGRGGGDEAAEAPRREDSSQRDLDPADLEPDPV